MHKHAVLLQALSQLTGVPAPLQVIDTHAGAGVYDLSSELALKSGEAEAGARRLMADETAPDGFALLKTAVATVNGNRPLRLYPGSPWLIANALRPIDSYVGCELRQDDYADLERCLLKLPRPGPLAQAIQSDGFEVAAHLSSDAARTLIVIDPPYERRDDYARIVRTLGAASRLRSNLAALIWAPIKDLETFDALLRGLETLPFHEGWAAEVRRRPLRDPMRLNGSVLIGLGLPEPAGTEAICAWTAATAREVGALGRVTPLFV